MRRTDKGHQILTRRSQQRGNVLVELLLLPMLLLPLSSVVVRAWAIQRTELGLTEVTRTIHRVAALSDNASIARYRAITKVALADVDMTTGTTVLFRQQSGSKFIVLRRTIEGLLPGTTATVERSVEID